MNDYKITVFLTPDEDNRYHAVLLKHLSSGEWISIGIVVCESNPTYAFSRVLKNHDFTKWQDETKDTGC